MENSNIKQNPNSAWLNKPRISRPDLTQRPTSLNNNSKQTLKILKKILIKVVFLIK